MSKIHFLQFLLLLTQANPAKADWKNTLENTWDSTEELGGKALEQSRHYYQALADGYDALNVPATQNVSPADIVIENSQHLKKTWPEVLENLHEALELNTQIDNAPASRWFGTDKQSLTKDQVEIFSAIEVLLANPAITTNREHIDILKERINDEKQRIASLKEKRVIASADEKLVLDKKIQDGIDKIAVYSGNIDIEKNNLKVRLQEMGLLLTHDQVDVLLSRVDSDDIIQMSVMYDVLANITQQLMALTQEFNEDIHQARKYYGMHVMLLKFVLNMQNSYIGKLDNEYLPKIDAIRNETLQLSEESTKLLASETKTNRRNLLQKNLEAQKLTLKVANLYAEQLNKQKQKVQEAQGLVQSDYRVAKNTFDTVKLSADLLRLMKTNQASFTALMNIQIPDIVPFENLEMQQKFEELSALLRQ